MNTFELISIVERQGATLKRQGDMLEVVNGQQLPLETINLLKQHKADLLAHLCAGDAQMIEPLEQSNDAITSLQQRALNGLSYLLDVKKRNLTNNGHLSDNAMVLGEEWRTAVRRTLNLSFEQMDKLEVQLHLMGAISYEASHLYVVHGDWQPMTSTYRDNLDFMLADDSGSTFLNWLYH